MYVYANHWACLDEIRGRSPLTGIACRRYHVSVLGLLRGSSPRSVLRDGLSQRQGLAAGHAYALWVLCFSLEKQNLPEEHLLCPLTGCLALTPLPASRQGHTESRVSCIKMKLFFDTFHPSVQCPDPYPTV